MHSGIAFSMKDTCNFAFEFAYDASISVLPGFGAELVCLASVVLYSSTLCVWLVLLRMEVFWDGWYNEIRSVGQPAPQRPTKHISHLHKPRAEHSG